MDSASRIHVSDSKQPLRWTAAVKSQAVPLLKNEERKTIHQDPCDSKGYTHTVQCTQLVWLRGLFKFNLSSWLIATLVDTLLCKSLQHAVVMVCVLYCQHARLTTTDDAACIYQV